MIGNSKAASAIKHPCMLVHHSANRSFVSTSVKPVPVLLLQPFTRPVEKLMHSSSSNS